MVVSIASALGDTESITVMFEVVIELLPFTSITVSVITFNPASAQSNVESDKIRESMAQLSLLK